MRKLFFLKMCRGVGNGIVGLCVCVEAQGLMYDVYICVLPKQEKVVPDISPIPWFQQVYLSSYLRLDVTSSA